MTAGHIQPPIDTAVAEHVAERLTSLGRNPDAVTRDAVVALGECCHGSRRRLQTLLTAALFLASTDSAPAVTADHVTRAAAMQAEADEAEIGQGAPARVPRTPRPSARERLAPPRTGKTAGVRRRIHPLVPLAVASIMTVGVLAPHPIGDPEAVTVPAAASSGGKLPPPEEVYVAPRPPVAAIPTVMPRVVIDCVVNDPTAWRRANSFAVALHKAGIRALRIETIPPPATPAVYYAFEAERVGAEYVARLFTDGERTLPVVHDETQGLPPGTIRIVMQ